MVPTVVVGDAADMSARGALTVAAADDAGEGSAQSPLPAEDVGRQDNSTTQEVGQAVPACTPHVIGGDLSVRTAPVEAEFQPQARALAVIITICRQSCSVVSRARLSNYNLSFTAFVLGCVGRARQQ